MNDKTRLELEYKHIRCTESYIQKDMYRQICTHSTMSMIIAATFVPMVTNARGVADVIVISINYEF